jgi:hypothetical protein
MKLGILFLLLATSAHAQSVTVTYKGKSENLKTVDSLTVAQPCKGIYDTLSTSDVIAAIAHTPVAAVAALAESLPLADSIALARQSLLTLTLSFPGTCVLMAKGIVACTALANSVTAAIAGGPAGTTVSSSSIVVTGPPN